MAIAKTLLLLLPMMALASCAGGNVDASSSPQSPADDSSSGEVSSPSGVSSGKDYSSSLWGEEAARYMDESFGVELPYPGDYRYEFEMEPDEYGDPTMWVYLYVDEADIEKVLGEYATTCYRDGYEVIYGPRTEFIDGVIYTFNVYVGDKKIDDHWGIELTFLEGSHNGKECIGIYATKYILVNKAEWPTYMLEYYNGHDIPHYVEDAGGLSYEAWVNHDDAWGNYVGICVEGADLEAGESYADFLYQQGYTIYKAVDELTDGDLYLAEAPYGDECIYFYYDLESYYGFYIYALNISAAEFMEA